MVRPDNASGNEVTRVKLPFVQKSQRNRRNQLAPISQYKTWPVEAQVQLRDALAAYFAAKERQNQIYYNDPVLFARECIDWGSGSGLTSYQQEILNAMVAQRRGNTSRVAVRGPHTLGKTTVAAIAILWFALTRDDLPDKSDWKVVTTASVSRQLTDFLWPEVRKWANRIKWDKVGRGPFTRDELMSETLKLKTGKASSMTSSEETGTEGAHADHLLYIFDEAKAIEASRWDAAEGALMGGQGKEIIALAISTPGDPQGRFYEIHMRRPGLEDWWTRHVTIDECIAAGRATIEFVNQRRRQWGESSAVFQNRVIGNFCESTEDCVIPLSWVEAANERWLQRIRTRTHGLQCPPDCLETHWNWIDAAVRCDWPAWEWRSKSYEEELSALGVDIARSDLGDKTVLARKQGETITELNRMALADTMPIVGRVKGILERWVRAYAVVDIIGIGSGPFDRLREIFINQQNRIQAFNASEATEMKDRAGELSFSNKRSAAWWNMRELLDPAYDSQVALPPCDILTGDLTAPKRGKDTSSGKITVESKKDIRKRLGRSTDDGDSVVQAFFPRKRAPVEDPAESVSYVEYV